MKGNYALVFDVGSGYSYTLSQAGDVPAEATALDLEIALPGARAEVRLDGTLVYEKNTFEPSLIQDISYFCRQNGRSGNSVC
jgi:hypothetical protein